MVQVTDALLNYETVKYFTNEEMESENYKAAIVAYQRAETVLLVSLNALNFVQGTIMFGGVAAGMTVCAAKVRIWPLLETIADIQRLLVCALGPRDLVCSAHAVIDACMSSVMLACLPSGRQFVLEAISHMHQTCCRNEAHGAVQVTAGALSVGDAVLFLTLMSQIYAPLNFFGSYYRQIQRYMIDMENMFDLLGTPPAVADAPGARALALRGGAIEFQDVWFGYKPERLVLKDLKLTVRFVSVPCAVAMLHSCLKRWC